MCVCSGGIPALVISAGYLGSLLWGGAILLLAAHTSYDKTICIILGVLLLLVALLWVRPVISFGFVFSLLTGAGLVYLALGALLMMAFLVGGIESSLFPTGWILPAVLLVSGALMSLRRRFDIAITLWAGLTLATFLLGVLLYVDALDLGFDDPAAFDASIMVAAFGLVVLVLRPAFRD